MKTKRILFWALFLIVQAFGLTIPLFGNVHLNIGPILVGLLLLQPGSIVIGFFKVNQPLFQYALVIAINAAFWWFFIGREISPSRRIPGGPRPGNMSDS
jgi:hypothetical protein